MTHRDISQKIDQDFDDLKVRNPKKYEELEQKYRRLQNETNFAVSQSPVHIQKAERRP